jgi:hypothetical protein
LKDGVAVLLSSQSRPLANQSHTREDNKPAIHTKNALRSRSKRHTSFTVTATDLVVLTDALVRAFGANADFS